MTWSGLSVLAVVPARGGSKSIPKKNLQPLKRLSLIGHAARIIRGLDWVDAAVLSTDDEEHAREGRLHGLDVPFLRPEDLASDTAKSVDMWRHAWLASEEHFGRRFDLSVLLEPTSPLRRAEDVVATVAAMVDHNAPAAATISPTPAHYTPHKTLTLTNRQRIGFYLDDGARFSRRQDIPAYYHRNGACYAVRRETLVDQRQIIERDAVAVVIGRPMVNIDEPLDLLWAEFLIDRFS